MSQINSYKQLTFWQKSKQTSLSVVSIVNKLPKNQVSRTISDQMLRSSFSVGANIAEGFGKYKGKEYARFIQIALGSARETEYWLELLKDIYPNTSQHIEVALQTNSEVIKMLVSTLNSLRKNPS